MSNERGSRPYDETKVDKSLQRMIKSLACVSRMPAVCTTLARSGPRQSSGQLMSSQSYVASQSSISSDTSHKTGESLFENKCC